MSAKWWIVGGLLLLCLWAPARSFAQTPTAAGGDVVFQDDFSGDGGYLGTYAADDGESRYADGVYHMTVVSETSFIYGVTTEQPDGTAPKLILNDPLPENVSIEVDATVPQANYQARYGIAVGWQGDSEAYTLLVGASGRSYAITKIQPLTEAQAQDPTGRWGFHALAGQAPGAPVPAIKAGAGATNHLRVDWGRTGLVLYVNGQKLAEYPLEQPLTGDIALFADTISQVPFQVDFDNLVVRRLPAAPKIEAVMPESGQILFRDDFSNAQSGWQIGTDYNANATTSYQNGTYRVSMMQSPEMWYSAPTDAYRDVSAEVTFTFLQGHEMDYAGLVVREIGDVYYDFSIGWDGTYQIGEMPVDGEYITLLDWLPSNTIHGGDGGKNTVRVDCVGDIMTFTINGQQVEQIQDEDIAAGYAGVEAGSSGNADSTFAVAFDNFILRQP